MNRVRRQEIVEEPSTNIQLMTAKEVAQTFVVNDIIMHELILEAINSIEETLSQTDKIYSQAEIINRICVLVSRDELASQFDIKREDILWVLKTEYTDEILSLAMYNMSHNQKK